MWPKIRIYLRKCKIKQFILCISLPFDLRSFYQTFVLLLPRHKRYYKIGHIDLYHFLMYSPKIWDYWKYFVGSFVLLNTKAMQPQDSLVLTYINLCLLGHMTYILTYLSKWPTKSFIFMANWVQGQMAL